MQPLAFHETFCLYGMKEPPEAVRWYYCPRQMLNLSRWLRANSEIDHVEVACQDGSQEDPFAEGMPLALTFTLHLKDGRTEDFGFVGRFPLGETKEVFGLAGSFRHRGAPIEGEITLAPRDEITCWQFGVTFSLTPSAM